MSSTDISLERHDIKENIPVGLLSFRSDPASLSTTKLSGNIPVTPLSVPLHQPSSTWKKEEKGAVKSTIV